MSLSIGEVGNRHAPGLVNGLIAAGHADIADMGYTPKLPVVANQELPAPDRSIDAVTGAIEGDADHRFDKPILSHATCHVGMVMLHGLQLNSFRDGSFLSV